MFYLCFLLLVYSNLWVSSFNTMYCTYKLIWWNSSCSCRRISARSCSVDGEEDSDDRGVEEPQEPVVCEWRAHSAMLCVFMSENTRWTLAPTEWLGPVFWGGENIVELRSLNFNVIKTHFHPSKFQRSRCVLWLHVVCKISKLA